MSRVILGLLAAGSAVAFLGLPAAAAEPTDPTEPASPTAPTAPSTVPLPGPAPEPTAANAPAADDCSAAALASTISSVTAELSTYFAANPDVNQAMIDATRQPSFIAVGQFDDYFRNNPAQADAIRAIQAPYAAFKERCGLQVAPTDAMAVLAEV